MTNFHSYHSYFISKLKCSVMTANDCETHSYEVLDFCARSQKIQKLQITNTYKVKMSQSKIKKTGLILFSIVKC
jgi:hypothetical protein